MISLGKFIALPSDDLSLAEVLKSPIFGLTDTDLLTLTENSPDQKDVNQDLWTRLNTTSAPQFLEARGVLRRISDFAAGLAPYEFYARVLSTLMPRRDGELPQSVLRRLYSRLGVEAADPIEAFLGRALAHQRKGPPSLDRFLREMDGDGSVLKREADGGQNEVRVMTVHGSKGLEAPVVILPDTTQMPDGKGRDFEVHSLGEIGKDKDPFGGFVPKQSDVDRPAALEQLKSNAERKAYQEYLRLLYVGLTRAESRLVICGFQSGGPKAALKENCWYDWARRAFDSLGDDALDQPLYDGSEIVIKALGSRSRANNTCDRGQPSIQLPQWAQTHAPLPPAGAKRVTPSHLLVSSAAPAARSPLDVFISKPEAVNPFARGIIIHKLLEILPAIERARRGAVAARYLSAQPNITHEQAEQISREVFAVLDHPEFAVLFAPGTRAEVSLVGSASGLPDNIFMNAQIDRLAVTQTEVWIVDYKSNRPAPDQPSDIAPIYVAQMTAYRALAREIYPKKRVRCALLWTDVPRLMELPAKLMDDFDLRATLKQA